jgi:hypothetical protein
METIVKLLDFTKMKSAVAKQFELMSKHELFRVNLDGDGMWNTYLESFPVGTDPILRVRTEHNCSCCRQFIRSIGNAVAVIDGKIVSVWDIKVPGEPAYQVVADAMSRLVKSHAIDNIFLTTERTAGTDRSFESMVDKSVKTWSHYFVNVPGNFVCKGVEIGPKQSEARSSFDVLKRSLNELADDSIDIVLELINQNSLYRGTEHTFAVTGFQKLRKEYRKLEERQASEAEKNAFVWSKLKTTPGSIARIRNTSIGTLLVDLSNGLEMEDAVRKFEAMVAPANYKRPTALVTKQMVEKLWSAATPI